MNSSATRTCGKHIVAIALVCLLVLSAASMVQAQDGKKTTRKVGISASFYTDQTDILVPIWIDRLVIAPVFSFVSIGDAVTDYGIGVILRGNLRMDKAVPYASMRFAMLTLSPEGADESLTDYILGPAFGGEYFLDDHFSVSVEAQLNFTVSDETSTRFGNPDRTNINTASTIMATFYF